MKQPILGMRSSRFRADSGSIAFIVVVALTGCSTTNLDARKTEAVSISWLSKTLQRGGVYVRERGSAFLSVPSEESARLILDNKEVLDVYKFKSREIARDQAYRLSGLYPRTDVYLKDSLVVIRFTPGDTGLSHTLVQILGTQI